MLKQQGNVKKKKPVQSKAEIRRIKKQLKELNKRRKAKSSVPRSVQSSIPYLTEYENGILELKQVDNQNSIYSMTMEFEDTNYQILSVEKGETIFTKYRDLINSFQAGNFYQISIVKGDINKEKFKNEILRFDAGKKDNPKLNELRKERNSIILYSMSEESSDKEKHLYLTTSIKARNQLEAFSNFNRIEMENRKAFKKLDSMVERLDVMRRMEIYHDIYRPESTGLLNQKKRINYQQFFHSNLSIKDYICPDGFDFTWKDKFMFGNRYAQCLHLTNFPAILDDKVIGEIAELDMDMIITISISPYASQDAIKMIKRQITDMEKDKIDQQKKALKGGYDMDMINHDLRQSLDSAVKLLDAMRNNNQKLFDMSVLIMHCAKTEDELEQQLESLKSVTSKYLCHLAVLNNLQEPAMCQIIPYGQRMLPTLDIPMPSESVTGFIPFSSLEILDPYGCWYGRNTMTKKIIKIDRLKLMNSNGFILGTSGAGKSLATKNEINDSLIYSENEETIVIDPEGEYVSYDESEYFNSAVVNIAAGSEVYQNPFDMSKDYGIADDTDALKAKGEFLLSVFAQMLNNGEPLNAGQLGILDRCIREIYADFIRYGYQKEMTPTLLDVQKWLETTGKAGESEARRMAVQLEPFSRGLLNYFSHKTNVNIENKNLIIYNIRNLGDNLKPIGYLVMLDTIWNRVLDNRKKGIRTRVYADEFTVLLVNQYAKKTFWDMFKRFRKMGGVATGITQNITALLRDMDTVEMLANAEFLMLLNQKETDRIKLGEVLGLSEEQLKFVSDVEPGSGLIKAGRKIIPFELPYPKDTITYKIMTTKPDEIFSVG